MCLLLVVCERCETRCCLPFGQGVELSRSTMGPKTVFLRAGTFYLPSTVQLGAEDSGLTIAAYNGEEVRSLRCSHRVSVCTGVFGSICTCVGVVHVLACTCNGTGLCGVTRLCILFAFFVLVRCT